MWGYVCGKFVLGGWIVVIDFEGSDWEIFLMGYCNFYDMDFNSEGELFVYDVDMEWDMGMFWYWLIWIVYVISGSEFGWCSGIGKWLIYYFDSFLFVVDIGFGLFIGVCFGIGVKFFVNY